MNNYWDTKELKMAKIKIYNTPTGEKPADGNMIQISVRLPAFYLETLRTLADQKMASEKRICRVVDLIRDSIHEKYIQPNL